MLDWSGLTQSGSDRPLNLPQLDLVQIVILEDDIETIEEHFCILKAEAQDIYEADVLGTDQIELSALQNESGTSFDPENPVNSEECSFGIEMYDMCQSSSLFLSVSRKGIEEKLPTIEGQYGTC